MFSIPAIAQSIQIDSTFTTDAEIFPFENIELISELLIEGDVELNSDTSLVRVILEDENGFRYMVLEAYPLICPEIDFTVQDHCDETCALDMANPASVIIQIIDATLDLKSFSYETEAKENAETARYTAKRELDADKIEAMNQRVADFGMNWTSGDNSIVASYYESKSAMFGEGYNLLGYDYYAGGIFEFLGHRNYPKVDPDLVRHFDWRERHGANDSLSPYYDGDTLGTGWLTSVKNQFPYGTCWAFSSVGQTEAMANLYSNDTLDLDLSERQLAICKKGCNGGYILDALEFIRDFGIVTENCFPYNEMDCVNDSCSDICAQPESLTSFLNYKLIDEEDFDEIRLALIEEGPLNVGYTPENGNSNHAVVLCGYNFDNRDSSVIWLVKNSLGLNDGWGINGFCNLKVDAFLTDKVAAIETPVYRNDTALPVNCLDMDGDGYCWWGLGIKPANCNCPGQEDCNDNDPFVGYYDDNYNCKCIIEMDTVVHHISSDTTWTDSTVVNYTINIDSGACLTISAYVAFAPETRFIVNRGGKLIIDGGHLTKACPELWNGVEIYGQDTSQLMESYFGVVIVKNEALIENAKIGIANYCTVGDTNNEYNGGIIRAEFSTFLNNEIDIQLASFVNSWQGHEIPYSARIKKCNFVTTDSFYADHVPLSHIDMQDVFGVMLFGCVFRNESGFDYQPYPIRGIGINSIDANYMLHQYCNDTNVTPCINVDSCIFQRLEYGVKAMNALSSKTLSFSEIKFNENLVGISLSGINYAEVISNDFELTKCKEYIVPGRFNGGLFLEGCTGYHIEDDSCYAFLPPMTGGQSPFYGFGIKNSGPSDNEIYDNQFSHLEAGMICIGENRGRDTSGLCLKCNDMYENINDFLVVVDDGPPTGIQGIKIIQGVPYDTVSITAPAGNTFTLMDSIANPENITHYNYYNSAEDICYLHHQRQIYPLTYPTDTNYTNETIELHLINVGFQKPLACPSGIGGENELKNYSSPRQCIIDADNHISLLKIELNALVDGGNTDELNFDVMTSLPEDGEEIWLELLSDSPYLSDTVIKQAIFKEDVLPNAMIRDIMEANPQSAKKDEFFEALDNRYEPMPDYLIAQIMEGKNYFGAKEILEAQITSWQQIRSKAKHELMREFLLDTNVINPVDSIIAFLETENDIRSKYDLAFAYWEKKDTANAMAILNYIPAQFDLDEDQELTHQQYIDFFEILDQMAENHWNANDLDSSFVEDVYYLMENGDVKLAAHARGILVKGGFLKYIETVELPAYTKSSETMPYASGKIKNEIETDYLRLFPNPAGDYVIAYYNIEAEALSGVITIIDIKGNLLKRYNVKQSENQIVIDLKNLPNGLYIIGLYLDNRLLEAEKLSKGKN